MLERPVPCHFLGHLKKAGFFFEPFYYIVYERTHAIVAKGAKHAGGKSWPVELRKIAAFIGPNVIHITGFAIEKLAGYGIEKRHEGAALYKSFSKLGFREL